MSVQGLLMSYQQTTPSGLWTPSAIAGLRSWLVSDNPSNTLVSGELSVIADKSGNSGSASAGSSSDRAVLVSGGLNGRTIWRSDSSLKRGNFAVGDNTISQNAPGVTLAVVHRTNPAQGTTDLNVIRILRSGAAQVRAVIARGFYASNAVYAGGRRLDTDSYDGVNDNTNYSNQWLIIVATFNYASASMILSVNGNHIVDSSFLSAGNTSNTASSGTNIGVNAYGDYAEATIHRGALGVPDMRRMEGYLAWQWGLQANLPSGHPYKLAAP